MNGFNPASSLLRRLLDPFYGRRIFLRQCQISPRLGREIEAQIAMFDSAHKERDPIILKIDSMEGRDDLGSTKALKNLCEAIRLSRSGVWGLVTGSCEFSAMYVLQSCRYRLAVPEATLKFHDVGIHCHIDIFPDDDVDAVMRYLRSILERYKAFVTQERMAVARAYQRRIPSLELDVLVGFMREEVELSSKEALSLGVVDRIERVPPVLH